MTYRPYRDHQSQHLRENRSKNWGLKQIAPVVLTRPASSRRLRTGDYLWPRQYLHQGDKLRIVGQEEAIRQAILFLGQTG